MTKFGVKKPFDVLKDLSEKHKVLRKQAGLTQIELAKLSGVSLGSIKRFELTGQIPFELNFHKVKLRICPHCIKTIRSIGGIHSNLN
jgi:DNA-binding XRE family transcriptional regulator